MKQKVNIFTKGIGPFSLLIAAFVFAMFQGGFVSWFLFYTFLPFALYSLVLLFYPLSSFVIKRKVTKKEYVAGDTVEVSIILTRKNRFPLLYVIVEDEMGPPWGCLSTSLVFVGFKKSIEWKYSLKDVPRGKHIFQEIRLHTGDLIGLCQKKHACSTVDEMIIFPNFREWSSREFESLFSGNQGVSQRASRGQTMISGVREYQAGDRLSWINWKATAKTNKMMTKEFEEQKSEHLCLVLDLEPAPSFEHLVSFVASFVSLAINQGLQIGYVDAEHEGFLPIRKGERHRKAIFYQLAQVKPNGQGLFEQSLWKRIGTLTNQATLVVMTTQLTFEKLEAIRPFKKNQVVLCFVVQMEGMAKEEDYIVKEAALKRGIRVEFLSTEEIVRRRAL